MKKKIISLINYFSKLKLSSTLYIERVDYMDKTNNFLVYFHKGKDSQIYTKSVLNIFSNKTLLTKFNSIDAGKIGYYAAKAQLKQGVTNV